ncbi:MAG: creatininase [Pseudomonadota bacterium]
MAKTGAETVMMAEMAWPEFAQRMKADPVVFVPCGATEQHGPHLPLSVDALLPTDIAREVAEEVGGIVGPTLTMGYKSMPKSGGGPFFPGTVNLDGSTVAAIVRDVVRELVRHGARRLCFIVGHYENQWFVTEGIDLAMREVGGQGVRIMRLEYWDFCTPETLAKVFPDGFPGVALEHAAVMETSLMLHYHPEMVRLDKIPDNPGADFPPYDMFPPHREWVPSSGALISAKGATREKGRLMAEQYRRDIAAAVRKEFGLGSRAGGAKGKDNKKTKSIR